MKNNQIRISNTLSDIISLSLEPEGTIFELLPEESVTIDLIATDIQPIIDLRIGKSKDGPYIAIWPEHGTYEVIEGY